MRPLGGGWLRLARLLAVLAQAVSCALALENYRTFNFAIKQLVSYSMYVHVDRSPLLQACMFHSIFLEIHHISLVVRRINPSFLTFNETVNMSCSSCLLFCFVTWLTHIVYKPFNDLQALGLKAVGSALTRQSRAFHATLALPQSAAEALATTLLEYSTVKDVVPGFPIEDDLRSLIKMNGTIDEKLPAICEAAFIKQSSVLGLPSCPWLAFFVAKFPQYLMLFRLFYYRFQAVVCMFQQKFNLVEFMQSNAMIMTFLDLFISLTVADYGAGALKSMGIPASFVEPLNPYYILTNEVRSFMRHFIVGAKIVDGITFTSGIFHLFYVIFHNFKCYNWCNVAKLSVARPSSASCIIFALFWDRIDAVVDCMSKAQLLLSLFCPCPFSREDVFYLALFIVAIPCSSNEHLVVELWLRLFCRFLSLSAPLVVLRRFYSSLPTPNRLHSATASYVELYSFIRSGIRLFCLHPDPLWGPKGQLEDLTCVRAAFVSILKRRLTITCPLSHYDIFIDMFRKFLMAFVQFKRFRFTMDPNLLNALIFFLLSPVSSSFSPLP